MLRRLGPLRFALTGFFIADHIFVSQALAQGRLANLSDALASPKLLIFAGNLSGCDKDRTCDPLTKSQPLDQTARDVCFLQGASETGQSENGPKLPVSNALDVARPCPLQAIKSGHRSREARAAQKRVQLSTL